MPRLQPPPPMKFVSLSAGKDICPRCAGKYLDPSSLRCVACTADFTPEGLAYWRTLPLSQALRT